MIQYLLKLFDKNKLNKNCRLKSIKKQKVNKLL